MGGLGIRESRKPSDKVAEKAMRTVEETEEIRDLKVFYTRSPSRRYHIYLCRTFVSSYNRYI